MSATITREEVPCIVSWGTVDRLGYVYGAGCDDNVTGENLDEPPQNNRGDLALSCDACGLRLDQHEPRTGTAWVDVEHFVCRIF